MKTAILTFCFAVLVSDKHCAGWSYRGEHGPDHWVEEEGGHTCLGHHQSPIDIKTSQTSYKSFPPFTMQGYNVFDKRNTRPVSIENNAHTVQVNLHGDYLLSGGGLPSTYKAVQFHLHWGSNDTLGSEHTKNDMHYPAEMHIVHYDTLKYASIQEAKSQHDGLAVLGFWIKIGKRKAEWSPFIRHLRQVKFAHHTYEFKKPYVLSSLLPTTNFTNFYRYNGSLTTPGCYESVIWTIFQDEIEISRKQLKYLRELTTVDFEPQHVPEVNEAPGTGHNTQNEGPPGGHGTGPRQSQHAEHLEDNFRPIQELWDRKVYQSWPLASDDANTVQLRDEPQVEPHVRPHVRHENQDTNNLHVPIVPNDHSRTDVDSLRKENNNLRIENNILRITNNNLLIENNNMRTANEHLAEALTQYDPRKCQQDTQANGAALQESQPSTQHHKP